MAMKKARPWGEAADATYDKAHGIKEGSPRDNALDRKRGLPMDTKKKGKK
jgi:hypothetical protein